MHVINLHMAKPSISTNFFIVIIFILLSITPYAYAYSNNQTDFEALLAFKKSIDRDPLGALTSWNQTMHFCQWNGVSCSKRHPNRVVSLSLRSQGLVGSLSPHIGNLSFLRTIILQNNTFRGPIPQEIGRLTRLQFIEFSNNSFGGGIPPNISHCKNLHYLNLIQNQLTGPIIPELGSLNKLDSLGLSRNLLSGSIPPFLGNLTNLTTLSLVECGLQGEIPESLAQLRGIRYLTMYGNKLTGEIPIGLFNISSMVLFAVAINQLHGTIPSFTLPNLWYFDFGFNHFTGPLPASLLNSSLIEHVRVSSNNFTGEMIDLTRLPLLTKFVASSNHLKGDMHTILSSLSNSTRLQSLDLDDNLFTGFLPDSIGNLSTKLYDLSIGSNQLSGSIPSSIGNLVGLILLSVTSSNLQGSIPSSIGKLHKLQQLFLGANRLTNEIPLSFGNLTMLSVLDLERNNLFGSIPPNLANCTNLLSLDLSHNNLNGSIPPEISKLSSISIKLDLSYNVLAGPIPLEVGALRNLLSLDLSHNRFSGNIPSSLSSCVMLERLHLGSNFFRGEIPNSLEALRSLQYLDLSQNNFSGKIPAFLAELPLLLYLNISFNVLEGEVPTVGVFQNETAISLQGNQDLCGGIPILNLTSCSSPNSKNRSNLRKILIPTAGAICLALLILCLCVIMYKRRTIKNDGTPAAATMGLEFLRLSYADLLNATGGFSKSNLVGAGRFGSVYKGTIINDGEEKVVAVKVLNLNIRGAFKSLATECNALKGLRHRNLLKIISVCDSIDFQGNDFKALVYEFMLNGSLDNWLHHNSMEEEEGRVLSISQRLDIAIDIASGVEYLHRGTNSIVIHGDLKPSNILLDQDMVAHVGDFGLAKIITQNLSIAAEDSTTSTTIKGTIGYIPPEYGMKGIVSTRGDAYSYGILVLEMFTNINPTTTSDDAFVNLQDFVSSGLAGRIMDVVDPYLHKQLNEDDKYWECVGEILKVGLRCSKELPRDRMSMGEAVNQLKEIRNALHVDVDHDRIRDDKDVNAHDTDDCSLL